MESDEDAARRRVIDRLVPSKVNETIKILQSNGLFSIDCFRKELSEYLRDAGICDRDVSDLTSTNDEWSASWRDNFIRDLPTRCQNQDVIEPTRKALHVHQTRAEFVGKVRSRSIFVPVGVRLYIDQHFSDPSADASCSVHYHNEHAPTGNSTSDNMMPDRAIAGAPAPNTSSKQLDSIPADESHHHETGGNRVENHENVHFSDSIQTEDECEIEAEAILLDANNNLIQNMAVSASDKSCSEDMLCADADVIKDHDETRENRVVNHENGCAEMSSVPNETGLSAAPRVKIEIFNRHCLSCGQLCTENFLTCEGCQAPIHLFCLESSQIICQLIFVCLLCRNYDTNLNQRIVSDYSARIPTIPLKKTKRNHSRVCFECFSDILANDTVLCPSCGTYFCATACAILGLQASSDESFTPLPDWKCRWCLGRNEYQQQTLLKLKSYSESALIVAADMNLHVNLDGQVFAQIFFDVWNQRDQFLINRFKDSYAQLVKLENTKAKEVSGYMQCFPPSQLIEFSFTTEADAFSAADSHAKFYYQKAPNQTVKNLMVTNTERKRGAVVTSDCTMHPTWQMSQKVLERLHETHFELFFFLLKSPEQSRLDALIKSAGADHVHKINNSMKDHAAAQRILEINPFFVLYLDGHTGTRPGLWGSVEKMAEFSKMNVHLLVFNAYPGVYGGRSRTIVDKFVATDPTLYESSPSDSAGTASAPYSKTCFLKNSYHLTRTLEDMSIKDRLLDAQSKGHNRSSHGFQDTDLVLGFPGRLARFNEETQKCFLQIKKSVGALLKIYLNVNNSPINTVLNIHESLMSMGFDSSDIKFVQSLPPDEDEKRMRSVLTVFGNAVCGYGLHSSASNALGNGIVGVTIEGITFVERVMASILRCILLGELCVADESKYVATLCRLLTEPDYLEKYKLKLEPQALRQTSVFNSELGALDLAELINSLQIDVGISGADQPITLAKLPAAIPANVSQLTASDEFSFGIEDWCVGSKVVGLFMVDGEVKGYQGEIVERNTTSMKFVSIDVLYNDGEKESYTVDDLEQDSDMLKYHHQLNPDTIGRVNEMLYLLRLFPVDSEKKQADEFRLSSSVGQALWTERVTIFLEENRLKRNRCSSDHESDGSSSWVTICERFVRLQPLLTGASAAHTLLTLNAGVSSSNQKEFCLDSILFDYSVSQGLGVTDTKIIQKICDAFDKRAIPVHWMGVQGTGGFGIVIHGKAVIRGMGHDQQNFVAKFEIDKCDSETSAIRRELNILREYDQPRKPNNCIPSTVGLFQGLHHYGEIKVDGITARIMVMEKLEPYLQPLRDEAQKLFLSDGRLLPAWRNGCRDALNALLFLHTNDVAHLDLKSEHFMKNSNNKVKVVDYGLSQTSKNNYRPCHTHQRKVTQVHASSQQPTMTYVQKVDYRSTSKPMLNILGYGTPGYKAPEIVTEGCSTTIKDRKKHDLWSLGIIFMEAVYKLPQDTDGRNQFEKDLLNAVSEKNFKTFLDFIIKPNLEGSPAHFTLSNAARIEAGEQALKSGVAEQDRIMQVRAGFVLELLRLVFQFLNPAAEDRISIESAFVSCFISEYQPVSLEEEYELIIKGKMVDGIVNPDGENQNPSVILLIPGQGLHTLSLIKTKAGAPVGGYGGVCSCLTARDSAVCAERFCLHVLPAAGLQIDGSPGINVTLDNLAKARCPGSLFASSRVDPSESREGNVLNPQTARGKPQETVLVNGTIIYSKDGDPPNAAIDDRTVIYSYPMYARIDMSYGISFTWCYNWSTVCGGCALSEDLIAKRMNAHGKGIPEHAMEIVLQRRAEVLAAGIFFDYIPDLGITETSMPDGGGELVGPVSRKVLVHPRCKRKIKKNPGKKPNAVRKARQPIDMIHALFKTVSGGGAEGGSEGLSGSVRAMCYKRIYKHLGINGNMVVDLGAGDGRMLMAAIAGGASKAIGYELPGNASRKCVFDAAQKKLKEKFPEMFPWDNVEWIGQSIDEVISLLIASGSCLFFCS